MACSSLIQDRFQPILSVIYVLISLIFSLLPKTPKNAARDLESDSEPFEEREPSRTVVKFSEEATQEKETPFVRQNTPHPKDLKAKAQKLKVERSRHEDNVNLVTLPEEVSGLDPNARRFLCFHR